MNYKQKCATLLSVVVLSLALPAHAVENVHEVVLRGTLEDAKMLVRNGLDVNQPDNGFSPLSLAILWKKHDVVKLFLEHGADVNGEIPIRPGTSPLLFATSHRADIAIIKILLAHGAKINAIDNEGDTPLILASLHEHAEIVKLLLRNGANPNKINYDGKSALDYAIHHNNQYIVRILKAHNAYR